MVTIKKYSNRRLYDTSVSTYITLEELADKIRSGADVRVVHAKTDEDITQQVLAQIILESRGAAQLLPVPLLMRLIRMGDDNLAEFFGQFMSWSLELYLRFKQGAETMQPYSPFGNDMFPGPDAFFRMFMNQSPWGGSGSAPWQQGEGETPPPVDPAGPDADGEAPEPVPDATEGDEEDEPEVEELRSEIDELKQMVRTMAEEADSEEGS